MFLVGVALLRFDRVKHAVFSILCLVKTKTSNLFFCKEYDEF
jgi:hypothetical protein